MSEQMRCERCKAFIGEDCLEGHDGTFFGSHPGSEDGYTGVFYCAPGKGCNAHLAEHNHACCPPDDCCGGPCAAHPCWELTT